MPSLLQVLFVAPAGQPRAPLEAELCRGGFQPQFTQALDAAQACTLLATRHWDLVLCSGELADSTGSLLRTMAEQGYEAPLFIISAPADEARAMQAMQAGAHDYIRADHLARLAPALRREQRELDIHRERNHALAALRESETRFRQLTENIDEVFWLADCVSGHLIYVSPACERLWGRPAEMLFGSLTGFIDTVHPEDVPRVEAWTHAGGWNALNGEYRILQPDGAVRWVCTRSFPIPDAAGHVYRSAGLSSDITDSRRMEAETKKMSRALEQTADAVMITDCEGRIEYVNAAFEDITGYTVAEVLGKTPALLRSGLQESDFYRQVWTTLLSGLPFFDVFINRRKDGELYYEEKTITPVRDESGNITHFVSTGKDITRRLQAQQRLHRVMHYDALTGLANRILLSDRLNQSLLQARRLGLAVGVVCIGIDLSGLFGAQHEHGVEERFQRLLGQRLKAAVAEGDTVARLGRDEFAIIHKHAFDGRDLEQLVQRLMLEFSTPLQLDGYELFATPSIGTSRYPEDGAETELLLVKATNVMRHAQECSGGQAGLSGPAMLARTRRTDD